MGRLFIVVPSSGLLDNRAAHLQQFDLTLTLTFDSMCNCLERVEVLHLGTGTELLCSHFTNRQVNVRTHGTFLQLTVRCSKILNDQTQFLKISDNLICISHIWLGYDLDQRYTGTVIVY